MCMLPEAIGRELTREPFVPVRLHLSDDVFRREQVPVSNLHGVQRTARERRQKLAEPPGESRGPADLTQSQRRKLEHDRPESFAQPFHGRRDDTLDRILRIQELRVRLTARSVVSIAAAKARNRAKFVGLDQKAKTRRHGRAIGRNWAEVIGA